MATNGQRLDAGEHIEACGGGSMNKCKRLDELEARLSARQAALVEPVYLRSVGAPADVLAAWEVFEHYAEALPPGTAGVEALGILGWVEHECSNACMVIALWEAEQIGASTAEESAAKWEEFTQRDYYSPEPLSPEVLQRVLSVWKVWEAWWEVWKNTTHCPRWPIALPEAPPEVRAAYGEFEEVCGRCCEVDAQ